MNFVELSDVRSYNDERGARPSSPGVAQVSSTVGRRNIVREEQVTVTPSRDRKAIYAESADYENTEIFFDKTSASESISVEIKRCVLAAVVGIVTGLITYLVSAFSQGLVAAKLGVLYGLVEEEKLQNLPRGLALLFHLLANVICGYMAWFVVFIEPTAQASGIVDVKCYLNGLLVQSAINVRTLAFRTIGATCAVGSGLLVGTEGPMVQAGVALAAAISRGIWDCGLQDLLDYYWVCCFGRGAGRSPRAECCTLLRFPEFNNDAEMRGFIACGAAAGLAAALGTPIGGLLYVLEDHHNFWTTRLSGRCLLSSICAVIAVSVCAVGEGQSLTAATKNTDMSVLQGYTLEGVLLAAAMGVMGGCFGSLFVLANTQLTALRHRFLATDMSTLAEVMALVTLGGMLSYGLPLAFGNCLDIPGGAGARLVVFYCAEGQYNDLGSLFLADSSTVTSILFNGPGLVGNSLSLFVFCFVYAGLACLACGSYVSGGLFIPSLVFGGALGRTAGTVLTSSGLFAADLGLCAVSGAAAVTVGILRTSPIAAAVILLEVTGKFSHAVPVLVGALSAHAVAAFISQGIYETMIAQMKLSFLGDGYVESSSLSRLRCARDVMTPHPVVLSATTSASDIEALLIDYSFRIFPVVDEGYRFLGSIRREVLREQLGQFKAHCDNEAAPDDEERLAMLDRASREEAEGSHLNISAFIETSAISIRDTISVQFTFRLFRRMELRQLAVVDSLHRVVGIITRSNLAVPSTGRAP